MQTHWPSDRELIEAAARRQSTNIYVDKLKARARVDLSRALEAFPFVGNPHAGGDAGRWQQRVAGIVNGAAVSQNEAGEITLGGETIPDYALRSFVERTADHGRGILPMFKDGRRLYYPDLPPVVPSLAAVGRAILAEGDAPEAHPWWSAKARARDEAQARAKAEADRAERLKNPKNDSDRLDAILDHLHRASPEGKVERREAEELRKAEVLAAAAGARDDALDRLAPAARAHVQEQLAEAQKRLAAGDEAACDEIQRREAQLAQLGATAEG